ncbi:MAG TPA: outer membrane protein assembly factor BamA [Vicinamibacterales bacterium]|nr:outer membrane protein assembly factor BamA [Vicinamibacterales bacterium]
MSERAFRRWPLLFFALAAVLLMGAPAQAAAQAAGAATPQATAEQPTLCGQVVPPPTRLPPADRGPVVYFLGLCFSAQGNVSAIEPETYMYYIRLRPSRPSQDDWVPYNDDTIDIARADFRRLWDTQFLDDITIEANDYVFANGVIGKLITYHLEERPRIKRVQYDGTDTLTRTKIDETLRERGIDIRLDSFLDPALINRAKAILRELMAEKGFPNAEITHTVTPLAGGPKLVDVTFTVSDGPRLMLRDVTFIGNRAVSDDDLLRQMKDNRAQSLLSVFKGGGTYNETKFADDAQNVEDHYRDLGYIAARVGQPTLRPLDDSKDGKSRWVQLRVPITEGRRYKVGSVTFEGNKILPSDALKTLFKLEAGEWYSQQRIREGMEKAREIYGVAGYMEFTGFPDLKPSDASTQGGSTGSMVDPETPPTVDVVMRLTEGPQYFINRITFAGNTTTRDNVIRRELRLIEGGVFNTEALKQSVRRLNQLGYFKPLEGTDKDLKVDKTPGREHAVDVTLQFQEQNRNQVQFGAGASQYEGLFGQLSYTTTNFLGRGESVTLSGQKGARSSVYQISFTEPYLFDRPITAGADLFSRKIDYLTGTNVIGYSEVRSGVNVTAGRALFQFSRAFLTYGYEVIDTAVGRELLEELDEQASVGVPVFNPFLDPGRHVESRITPSFVHNTVDNPFTPRQGRRLTLSLPVAGGLLGGTTSYIKPEAEAIFYFPHTRRTALGVRLNGGFVRPYGETSALPYYLRYFLGGEYQIRGVDIRTVGPTGQGNRAIGGDKFVLFNAEYYFDLFGPVRTLLFHDAGQAFAENERIDLKQLRTSSGVEVRVVVPMLNVPFRLIYAWNVYRDAFQPARAFKFAVGTTF